MPLIPEEPQIHESVPGPRATPAAGRTAPSPRPVPGPGPRPAPPRGAPAASARPGKPGPAAPPRVPVAAPPAQRTGSEQPAAGTPGTAAGAQLQLIPAPAGGAVDAADEAVDLLLDTGRAPGEILVLTTGDAHPWAAHELSFGETSYWAQHDAADDVFYADATAGRAAGRPVVVVAVNGGTDEATAQALPAAMARAGALLIVCGDPQTINAVLGAHA
ncbi:MULTISPECIES: hypothetical protein [Streptomyces]|uniref:Uncharacterized protein n=1 Tax=Streptomyces kasugaensis TaxID=1946 RepID=A0A4Q9HKZ0_STRKA|nr:MULTISPECIES: hypothetical protein [Streptomyces]MYU52014.1 hypothetical protein [Streptomyces sp. SID7805]TBO55368.1 hypothetical protein EYS09_33655 [Streptomyces kasugaensis]